MNRRTTDTIIGMKTGRAKSFCRSILVPTVLYIAEMLSMLAVEVKITWIHSNGTNLSNSNVFDEPMRPIHQ